MKPCGLVLQGGGALGAYEWGAICALVDAGYTPTVVSGVSIGAANAAAVAGARDGDIPASLAALWHTLSIPTQPLLPRDQQFWLSAWGIPGFFRPRSDYFDLIHWTGLCDPAPYLDTLEHLIDWRRLNDARLHRVCVTATRVRTGKSSRFTNLATTLTPAHLLASGSLPPAFPPTAIDGELYWDGGLFDNTPLRPLIEMLTSDESATLPIFVLDLFAGGQAVPGDLKEVFERTLEIGFENRYWDDYGGPAGLCAFAGMLRELDDTLPATSPLRNNPHFRRLLDYRALTNLHVVSAPHVSMEGCVDFSAATLQQRHDVGQAAMRCYLADQGLAG